MKIKSVFDALRAAASAVFGVIVVAFLAYAFQAVALTSLAAEGVGAAVGAAGEVAAVIKGTA